MNTAQTHPDEPHPLGASLRRSSSDRIVLGLCSGLARSAGLSPLAVRLAAVLASLFVLPLVLLAYTVTAVLVPRDDGVALVGSGSRDRRELWVALLLTLLAAPAALTIGTDGGPSLFSAGLGFLILPLIGLGALAFWLARRSGRDAAAWMTAEDGVDEPSAPTTPGASTASAPPTFTQRPAAPEPPKGPSLTLPVLAAVAAVPAVLAVLLALGAVDAGTSTWAISLAVMAVIAASGAVAITVVRPRYLSAAFLVLLAALLGVLSIGVSQVGPVLDDGVGERTYRATDPSELATPYVLGAGQLNLDLRSLRLQPRERVTVRARLGFGELNVAVPRGTRIVTTRASNADELTVTARQNGAANSESGQAPTIVLDLRGRGVGASIRTGSGRHIDQLDIAAQTEFGFWRGGRTDGPFTRTAGEVVRP